MELVYRRPPVLGPMSQDCVPEAVTSNAACEHAKQSLDRDSARAQASHALEGILQIQTAQEIQVSNAV